MIELVLGGARSGKSAYAEKQAKLTNQSLVYVATATALDPEMSERINHHQVQRSDTNWSLIEEPLYLGKCLNSLNNPLKTVVIDCLTLWLSNCMHFDCLQKQTDEFLNSLVSFRGNLILVSNEVGSGIVPLGKLSREYVDAAGRLHQNIAAISQKVTLVVAGLPLALKDE